MRQFLKATIAAGLMPLATVGAATAKIVPEEYFAEPGIEILVFSNWYDGLFSDAKISGVEMIRYGVRTMTNGDVRLSPTPGQWEPVGNLRTRRVLAAENAIEADLSYPAGGFDYTIRVQDSGDRFVITVRSDKVLPAALEGRAGFNLEFIPSVYGGQTMIVDNAPYQLSVYPHGEMILRPEGPRPDGAAAEPLPLATGAELALAPADERHRVTIRTKSGALAIYDGRNQAQNGWFVVRGELPAGKVGVLLEWELSAPGNKSWIRTPVISYNQLGYRPQVKKVAFVELDRRASESKPVRLLRFGADGHATVVKSGVFAGFEPYLRYRYGQFDFSEVTAPGVYALEYDGVRQSSFRIADDVYDAAWHPTLDVFFPAQMDHMFVNEAYRVWHGAAHLDDALQAPTDHEHHDLYRQGPATDTRFAPLQHIPGLNVGGWFDAGDFDIRTQSQYGTVRTMAAAWEVFRPDRDQTRIDWARRRADMHTPDGAPDLLQQIAHGARQLLAQHEAVGHAIHGIVEPDLDQYTHLGDAVTKTDGLIYKASLGPEEEARGHSGRKDDRWAFTSRSSALQYGSAAGLAAAARALKGFDDDLAERSLKRAAKVFAKEQAKAPDLFQHGNTTGGPLPLERFRAAAELLLATGDDVYRDAIFADWKQTIEHFGEAAEIAVRIRNAMPEDYGQSLRAAAEAYVVQNAAARADNPFGVEITRGGWAGAGSVVGQAITDYWLHTAYPDLVPFEQMMAGVHYILGRHPGHNLSLVSGVGAQSKKVAYGTNRANFSFIAGGVVPGMLIVKPDYPENREDWPFFWGQNEYVIPLAAEYIFLMNAVAR